MFNSICLFVLINVSLMSPALAQDHKQGNLFIIGGGKRPVPMMENMFRIAKLSAGDYIVVLPMASTEPDSAFINFKKSVEHISSIPVISFTSEKGKKFQQARLDSIANARLIFIPGGDQVRFMEAVFESGSYDAINACFRNGNCIAGTSAGAAVMSEYMITGKELLGDTSYDATYRKLWKKNVNIAKGLGLLRYTIIDQHFIVRSRFNRLISALALYPKFTCIGIDEGTAVHIHGNIVNVYGESQVVVMSDPKFHGAENTKLITIEDMRFSIYAAGTRFKIKE